jgi:hypothetical protein
MFRTQSEYLGYLSRRSRDWQEAQHEAEGDRLRRVRVSLIEGGLRAAIGQAPDAFPNLDVTALAGRVVDIIEA